LKVDEAVKEPISADSFMFGAHVPTAIRSNTTSGLYLYGTEARAF